MIITIDTGNLKLRSFVKLFAETMEVDQLYGAVVEYIKAYKKYQEEMPDSVQTKVSKKIDDKLTDLIVTFLEAAQYEEVDKKGE